MRILYGVLLAALAGCTQIDTGNVGVESTLGQVEKTALPPGWYQTITKKVVEVVGKEIPLQINDMKPQTSDKITLSDLDIDVYFKIDVQQAPVMFSKWPADLTQIGKSDSDGYALGMNYIIRQAREAVYDVVSRQNSATVHTKRVEIAGEVTKILQSSLDKEAGKGMFTILSINVRNLITDPTLEANIKAAANAQFALQREKNENEVALQKEQAALNIAKVQAERIRVQATAEADAVKIKAAAISSAGGHEYVQLQAIDKWDGKLPTSMPPNGAVPFIPIGK